MRQPDVERRALIVRLPLDAFSWVEAQVQRNSSSQSSEVLRLIRDQVDREREQAEQRGGR